MTTADRTSNVTIWHNPACATSRKVLAAIRGAGVEPVVVEYLRDPPSRDEIRAACRRMNIKVRDLLRRKAPAYARLELDTPQLSEGDLLDAIVEEPELIERPVVLAPGGARLCRPPELVSEIVPGAVIRG
ncbi:arsenate reductase (glutaredoxin) [Roseomonas elaeocarpi]|uniref:Arsenate reductase n=1 Tax=Roseomonas elaeocarpi TaxID=907779 RepID=A0ABV6JUX4_9PROT